MIFQNLFVPESQKDHTWASNVLQEISHYSMNSVPFNTERWNTFKNYEFYKGIYDMNPMSYLTQPWGQPTPATWRHFDFLRVKFEKIIGDYLGQPLSYYAHITNREGVERKLDLAVKVALHQVTQPHQAFVKQMTGMDIADPSVAQMSPDEQQQALGMTAKDYLEKFGEDALDYLINRYNIDAEYAKCLLDLCICSKAFMRVKIVNGDPVTRRVDPRAFIWDCDIDSDNLNDCSWAAEERFMTVNQILQEGGRFYTKDEIKKIKLFTSEYVASLIKANPALGVYFKFYTNGGVRTRVIDGVWCSTRAKEYAVSENPYDADNPVVREVTETYKAEHLSWYKKMVKGGNIRRLEGDDWWEGRMVGPDVFVGCRRMKDQARSQSYGYAQSPSPYKGQIKDAVDGLTISLLDRMEPVLLMIDEAMFNVNFLLGRTNGKVIQYDIAQQPDSLIKSQVMTMAKNHGFVFVDSRKEGVRSNAFNQFSTADMSNTNDIVILMNFVFSLESMIDNMIGSNRGWTGDTKASDTVGNTMNDVTQANSIMRPLYDCHSRLIEQTLNGMVDLFKYANWKETDRMSYILDDGTVKSFVIPEDFRQNDLGIKYKEGYEEKQKKQRIEKLSELALQSGSIDFQSVINIEFKADTAAESIVIFEQGLAVMQKQREAQAQAEAAQGDKKLQSDQLKVQGAIEMAKINASAGITEMNIKEQAQNDRNMFDKQFEATLEDKKHINKLKQIALENSNEELPEPQNPQPES